MIREDSDTQLDNIARTVFANQYANCHISLHFDSSNNNKGAFCINVPDISAYKNMEPVASHWNEHNSLAEAIVAGVEKYLSCIYKASFTYEQEVKLFTSLGTTLSKALHSS